MLAAGLGFTGINLLSMKTLTTITASLREL
jgi:hypothetical protein